MKLLPKDYTWSEGEYEALKLIYLTYGIEFPIWDTIKQEITHVSFANIGMWTTYERYSIMTDNGFMFVPQEDEKMHRNKFYPEFIEYISQRG